MNISKKKHLEIFLESIPPHPNPKVELEQYSTPATIASSLLWNAYNLNDIVGLKVADLGCGTGIFSIGASILGASKTIGIDIDKDSLEIAEENKKKLDLDIEFLKLDILNDDLDLSVDTVFQNPPFGSQLKSKNHPDRRFIELAMKISPVVYSIHMSNTEEFLEKYYASFSGKITHKFYYKFPIPKIYNFHNKERKFVDIIALRVEKY